MLSFLLPKNINIFVTPGFIKIEGPKGTFLKKTGDLKFYLFPTQQGKRLFIEGASRQEEIIALSYLTQQVVGLSRGFRQRLRLVGIGFRATIRELASNKDEDIKATIQTTNTFKRQNYLQKRIIDSTVAEGNKNPKVLFLKIGYSHEVAYPLLPQNSSFNKGTDIQVARLEGRSKGSLISLTGPDPVDINQKATEIRSSRFPDVYKGKGIHFDAEKIILKKGKRQG